MLKMVHRQNAQHVPAPSTHDIPDDLATLVDAARAGDARALRTLVFTVAPILLNAVRKIMGSHPDVEDVAQEAAIAFVQALEGFRYECMVRRFASRVGVITALAARRRSGVRDRFAAMECPDETLVASDCPLSELLRRRRRALLRNLLDELPADQAEALALHAIFEHTAAEIAASTRTTEGTVRSRLRLAKSALRARIESEAPLRELRLFRVQGRMEP